MRRPKWGLPLPTRAGHAAMRVTLLLWAAAALSADATEGSAAAAGTAQVGGPEIGRVPPISSSAAAVPGSVVVDGAARFTALTDRVVRIEYAVAGSAGFDDLPSTTVLERSPADAPAFHNNAAAGVLTLSTSALTLQYRQGGALLPAGAAGCDVLNLTVHSTGAVWCPSMGVAAPSQRNLNGSLETTDCCEGTSNSHQATTHTVPLPLKCQRRPRIRIVVARHSVEFGGGA